VYHALGWIFLQYLAEKINYWPTRYVSRRVSSALQAAAEALIKHPKRFAPERLVMDE